jgi:thymidine kinase
MGKTIFAFITGPMFSGKTEELLRIAHRYEIAGKKILVLKPKKDKRFGKGVISTHNNRSVVARDIKSFEDIYPIVSNHAEGFDAIFIDEIQFVEDVKIESIRYIVEQLKIDLFVCGLTLDSFRNPFPNMWSILPYAEIKQLHSVCNYCGDFSALFTYRKGQESTEQVFVGGKNEYSAICQTCLMKMDGYS